MKIKRAGAGRMLACILSGTLVVTPVSFVRAEQSETEYTYTEEIADGIYVPDDFWWSGGSGRVTITCDQVEIRDGQAYATIAFSSSSYGYVKLQEETYYPQEDQDVSTFVIPVVLNQETEIIGMTQKMSAPHEITYTVCVFLGTDDRTDDRADGAEAEVQVQAGDTGSSDTEEQTDDADAQEEQTAAEKRTESEDDAAPEIEGLVYESKMELMYADGFDVYHYQDGYDLIDVHDSAQYLVIPEDGSVPEGLDAQIVVLQKPLDTVYLAATSAMALYDALDALDCIRLTGTAASGWYIDDAVEALESGQMLFAGKYSEPDYELMISEGCNLAIESTMILHSPKVKEMIEALGIPVFVDYSSYESHPLGRTEWIRLYGVLTDKEEEADAFFEEQAKVISDLKDFPNTEKTVAFFYVSTSGTVVVRKETDYIPGMIEIAGGRYISGAQETEDEESHTSSMELTMEEFYAQAVDADYLIYNATIESPLSSIADLLDKSELFADFKAVQEGNVWCTGKYLYQATDIVGNLITDIHLMLTGDDGSAMTFLYPIR